MCECRRVAAADTAPATAARARPRRRTKVLRVGAGQVTLSGTMVQDPAELDALFTSDALELVLDAAPQPIMVVDPELRVRVWNKAAERHTGRRSAEVVGYPCIGALRAVECIGGCPALRGETDGSVTMVQRDGSHRHFQRSVRVIRRPDGAVLGIFERLSPLRTPRAADTTDFHGISTRSAEMRKSIAAARQVAPVQAFHVLVTGETGTGKGQLARAIYSESGARGPLVTVACGAGGAVDWTGALERARGGTLLLEHLHDLPLPDQRVLARLWPEVGAVRVIATARCCLEQQVTEGAFDPGLLYRLRQVTVTVPPLRCRVEDVMPLADSVLADCGARADRSVHGFSAEAAERMMAYDWPGNLRELSAVVAHAYALGGGAEIKLEDLPESVRGSSGPRSPPARDAEQADRVRWALARCDGRVSEAAELLGMSRSSFWRLRRRLKV